MELEELTLDEVPSGGNKPHRDRTYSSEDYSDWTSEPDPRESDLPFDQFSEYYIEEPPAEEDYCILHPCRIRLCLGRSYLTSKHRFLQLVKVLGPYFLAMMITVEWILQAGLAGGGTSGLIGGPIILLLSEYSMSASRMQILETIIVSAWCLKPIMALFMESIFIGGYNTIPYLMITSLTAFICCMLIVVFYPLPSPILLAMLLYPIFSQIATSDLLVEAKYTQKMRNFPELRPKLTAFVNMGQGAFQLLSIGSLGLLLYLAVPLNYIYVIPMPIFLFMLYPSYQNWIDDTERHLGSKDEKRTVIASGKTVVTNATTGETTVYDTTDDDEVTALRTPLRNLLGCFCVYRTRSTTYTILADDAHGAGGNHTLVQPRVPVFGVDCNKMGRNWKIYLLAIIIGTLAILANVLGGLGCSSTILFFFSLLGAFTMIAAFFLLMDNSIARIMTYVILQNMFSISLRAATYRFYTDDAQAYPEGPHFSREFYISGMGAAGIALSMLGTFVYDSFMTHWRYRTIFTVTGLIYVIACIPNFILFKRWNVGYVPDLVFVLGSEVMQVVVGTWNNMPYSVMILSLCRPGLGMLTYALYAGVLNLGNSFASFQGAFVLDALHINPTGNTSGESAQFENLWIASLISTGIQLIPLVTIGFLIPDSKQTDELVQATADDSPSLQQQPHGLIQLIK